MLLSHIKSGPLKSFSSQIFSVLIFLLKKQWRGVLSFFFFSFSLIMLFGKAYCGNDSC